MLVTIILTEKRFQVIASALSLDCNFVTSVALSHLLSFVGQTFLGMRHSSCKGLNEYKIDKLCVF